MRRMRLVRAALIAALVVGSSVVGSVAPAATAADTAKPATWCTGAAGPRLALKGATAAADGAYTPIVLVHGFSGDSSIWNHTVDRVELDGEQGAWTTSLQGSLAKLPGAAVFTYDYGRSSTDWITQDGIAGQLGTDIDCLASASGGKVIVVAHSMGGLALRYALHLGGSRRAAKIAEVVTMGTPNTGSHLAAVAQDVGSDKRIQGSDGDLFGLLSILKSSCATSPKPGKICGLWDQLWTGTRTPAAEALASGSAEMADLAKLAPWPAGVHVYALAGDMDIQLSRAVTWFGQALDSSRNHIDMGDVLVLTDSAKGGARDTHTASCSYALDVSASGSIVNTIFRAPSGGPSFSDLGDSGCWHANLTTDIGLAGEALSDVSQTLRALHAHFDPLTMQVPAMCQQAGGRMRNGLFPPGSAPGAVTSTPQDWVYTTGTSGTSDGTRDQTVRLSETQPPTDANGKVAAATAVGCFAGGSAIWPDSLVFSGGDGALLASFDLSRVTDGAHAFIRSIVLHGTSATVTWVGSGPLSKDIADDYLESTATFTYTGAKTLVMSNRKDSAIALSGTVDFGRIGSLTDAMTLAELKTKLYSQADADAGNPACAAITFGSGEGSENARILSMVSALAQSKGAGGPADMLVLVTGDTASQSRRELALLPKTAKGIGLGSTLAQVRAAYPRAAMTTVISDTQLEISDGAGRSIRFLVGPSNVVHEIATGRTKYLSTYDWCG